MSESKEQRSFSIQAAKLNPGKSLNKRLKVLEPIIHSSEKISNENSPIVGTSTAIDKPYFRLTSAPDPSCIRPQTVLEQSLSHVTDLWKKKERKYLTICDLFRSIRQDLTVQKIRNQFTVAVYETHAIVCMEASDSEELAQCLHMLSSLDQDGIYSKRREEFLMYRILFSMNTGTITAKCLPVSQLLKMSSPSEDPYIGYTKNVLSAWLLGNYYNFFQLCNNAPAYSRLIIDLFIERERVQAFKKIVTAYRPKVAISHVCTSLGFPDTQACFDFIQRICLNAGNVLDTSSEEICCREAISYFNSN